MGWRVIMVVFIVGAGAARAEPKVDFNRDVRPILSDTCFTCHGPDDAKRHVGDFGNLKADSTGNASYKRVDNVISLNGRNSIIGRSLIVHAKPDDFKTQQPPGNAGDRIGCGVIGIGDPKMMMH